MNSYPILDKADTVIIGGGMAYTFAKAQGGSIGKSLCEEDKHLKYFEEIMSERKNRIEARKDELIRRSLLSAEFLEMIQKNKRARGGTTRPDERHTINFF